MKTLKILILALGLSGLNSFAQVVAIEDLPVATINEKYIVHVPEIPIQEHYYIDISHLTFASEEEANKILEFYLMANVLRPEIHYAENYLILHVLVEYLGGDTDYNNLQYYLNHLRTPIE